MWSPFAPETECPLEPHDLIVRLIQSDSARLKLGVSVFFLVHPEKAEAVLQALPSLENKMRQLLRYYYMAAVYLQRLWKNQLSRFGDISLPDYFSKELGLMSYPSGFVKKAKFGLKGSLNLAMS